VTGAASGIGAEVSDLANRKGAKVIGLDRQRPSCTHSILVDLADPVSVERAAAALPERIDALCNIAGVPGTAPDESVIAVNFLGLRLLTELLRGRLEGGSVVNVASIAGADWRSRLAEHGQFVETAGFAEGMEWFRSKRPEVPAYNFSKEALIVWSMRRAWEWRARGPRINTVSPGPVETPILGDFRQSMGPALDMVTKAVGRNAVPGDLSPLVCFLADPDSAWLNGTDMVADGGFMSAVSSGAAGLEAVFSEA
jgi:NAD(P)-dependent dehydrogenase (short-subunit alcohol dehydrogenase family)